LFDEAGQFNDTSSGLLKWVITFTLDKRHPAATLQAVATSFHVFAATWGS
jgi:hypothetical protein